MFGCWQAPRAEQPAGGVGCAGARDDPPARERIVSGRPVAGAGRRFFRGGGAASTEHPARIVDHEPRPRAVGIREPRLDDPAAWAPEPGSRGSSTHILSHAQLAQRARTIAFDMAVRRRGAPVRELLSRVDGSLYSGGDGRRALFPEAPRAEARGVIVEVNGGARLPRGPIIAHLVRGPRNEVV